MELNNIVSIIFYLLLTQFSGATSQFKQGYLFSNLHTWKQNTQTNIWNFFAMSHGKGADGLGGAVKHCVWIFVKAGGNEPLDVISYS